MAQGNKVFVNNTSFNLMIWVFIREGDAPMDVGNLVKGPTIPAGGQAPYRYHGFSGSDGYVFLDGLLLEYSDGNNLGGVSQRVKQRGSDWDNTLNTNSTIVIEELALGTFTISGSN